MKKKNNRSLLRIFQPYFPKMLRYKIFRDRLVINFYISKKLEIRPAKTKEEFEEAYKILHDSYVENGYMQPQATGMRIIKHFALPSTTTLIAKWEGRIVGTASVIRRSPMGLPIESGFDIKHLINEGVTSGEVSSLAISKEFRNHRGVIFLPFCKYIFEYAVSSLKIQRLFIAAHPSWQDMYDGIFRLERISPKILKNYSFAHHNPAVGFYYDSVLTEKKLMSTYSVKPLHKNMYHFFYGFKPESFVFPETKYNKVISSSMSTEMFHYFFIERSSVYMDMTEKEKEILFSQYPADYAKDFYNYSNQKRKEGRFFVDSTATSTFVLDKKMHVVDISKSGLRVRLDKDDYIKLVKRPENEPFTVIVKVNNRLSSKVNVMLQWLDESSLQAGFNIIEHDEIWDDYLSYLNSDFDTHRTAA